MKTVREVSVLSGVSVRTLHHYDAIGLLKPAAVTEAGYRLYDEASLRRLRSILLLRELQFPLREIKTFLENPDFDEETALRQQIRLLELQKAHTEKLIAMARETLEKGVRQMDFSAFDTTEQQRYADEVRERWGHTEACRQSEARESRKSEAQRSADADGLMAVFARFGAAMAEGKTPAEAAPLAGELQQYITDHYYACTADILRSLGAMYTEDPRFTKNIDRAGGEGTAVFARKAIELYCG